MNDAWIFAFAPALALFPLAMARLVRVVERRERGWQERHLRWLERRAWRRAGRG